ncbi:MAG: hypothetical protein H0T46_00520 [Deltaproteobacteria bacterium]|nr:hypothetical protein [Deltaproteobacteria bacterium]
MESEAPENAENAALAGLLATISDRRIRRKVHKLLQHGEEAVRALGELDAALYLREDGEDQLQIVSDAVLSHFRRLLEYVAMVAPAAPSSPDTGSAELDFDENAAARPSGPISMRGMIAKSKQTDDDKWNALSAEMSTLQYGLGSELKNFERRFAHALKNDNREQAVRDLNDATTGLMDGVFAVMTTVYECFLGYAEPERMVPGHRDTLGKALAIRRALADLRRGVHGLNRRVQDRATRPDVAETNYQRIVDAMIRFVDSDVFNYLRSDTRRDFWQFRETLENGDAVQNRNDCEGFDKYLDSLSFISQRGVLIKHDTDLKTKISGDLERAVKFAKLLPEVGCDVIEQAFVKAERLSGLSDEIDRVVLQWSSLTTEDRADVDLVVPLARELIELVRPPPVATSSGSGDLF